MSAREEILARARSAVTDREDEPAAWCYERDGTPGALYRRTWTPEALAVRAVLFAERIAEYGSRLISVDDRPAAVAAAIEGACRRHGASVAVIPAGFPRAWRPAGLSLEEDRPGLPAATLAEFECSVTGAALAVAETGTIVFDGGARQGRRALSLVPDVHICVVGSGQVVGGVPEAIAALGPAVRSGRPITLASGPSATSDIGFERVVGVHGPRTLEVILVSEAAAASDADEAEPIR